MVFTVESSVLQLYPQHEVMYWASYSLVIFPSTANYWKISANTYFTAGSSLRSDPKSFGWLVSFSTTVMLSQFFIFKSPNVLPLSLSYSSLNCYPRLIKIFYQLHLMSEDISSFNSKMVTLLQALISNFLGISSWRDLKILLLTIRVILSPLQRPWWDFNCPIPITYDWLMKCCKKNRILLTFSCCSESVARSEVDSADF